MKLPSLQIDEAQLVAAGPHALNYVSTALRRAFAQVEHEYQCYLHGAQINHQMDHHDLLQFYSAARRIAEQLDEAFTDAIDESMHQMQLDYDHYMGK